MAQIPPAIDAPHPGPAFLLLPDRPDRQLATILRKVRLLALRNLLQLPLQGLDPGARAAMRLVQRVVASSAKAHGRTTLEAVGAVDVLVPLLCSGAGLCALQRVLDAVPTLLLGLSRSGSLTEAVLWDVPFNALADPATGQRLTSDQPFRGLLATPEGTSLRTADGIDVPLTEGSVEACAEITVSMDYLEVRPGLHLALRDSNPLAMIEEHPDKQGNALSLGDRGAETWITEIGRALDLIDLTLPSWGAALPLALQRLIPVGFEPELHLSASYREAPGMAYITLHPSTLTMAEAIVHETQHGRLNALNLLDPVFHNGRTAWTPSPVRPDLRPLMGVLLAVHAFVPVAVMHARMAGLGHPLAEGPDFARRRADVLAGNDRGLRICEDTAEASGLGQRLLTDLRRLHDWCMVQHEGTMPTPDENLLG